MNDIQKASIVAMWRAIPSIDVDDKEEDGMSDSDLDQIDQSLVDINRERASALGVVDEDETDNLAYDWRLAMALSDEGNHERAIAMRKAYVGMVDELASLGDDILAIKLLREINPVQTDELLFADCMVELSKCLAVRGEYQRSHAICCRALDQKIGTGIRAMTELAKASKSKKYLGELRMMATMAAGNEEWPGQSVINWLNIFDASADENDLAKARLLAGRYANPVRHSSYLSVAYHTLHADDWLNVVQNLTALQEDAPTMFAHYLSRTMSGIVSAILGHKSSKKFSPETAQIVFDALPKKWRDYVTKEVAKMFSLLGTDE